MTIASNLRLIKEFGFISIKKHIENVSIHLFSKIKRNTTYVSYTCPFCAKSYYHKLESHTIIEKCDCGMKGDVIVVNQTLEERLKFLNFTLLQTYYKQNYNDPDIKYKYAKYLCEKCNTEYDHSDSYILGRDYCACTYKGNVHNLPNSIQDKIRAREIIDRIVKKYDLDLIRIIDGRLATTKVKIKCKICGEIYIHDMNQLDELDKGNGSYKGYCCARSFKDAEVYYSRRRVVRPVNVINADEQKVTVIGSYEAICSNGHKFLLTNNRKELICRVCQEAPKFEFFKVLDEIKCIYSIEEDFPRTKTGVKRIHRIVKTFNILTKNELGHLTGKIVFDDLYGDKQAKANSNRLVFRWFDVNKLDDREYCLNFLYNFFDEINRKNKLGEVKNVR